eukprot:795785-Heterocapsa_arctica.AAC.1
MQHNLTDERISGGTAALGPREPGPPPFHRRPHHPTCLGPLRNKQWECTTQRHSQQCCPKLPLLRHKHP